MNYRKFYKEQTNTDIPNDFDIHHIDLNNKNNEINNLVGLPKLLHQKYHKALLGVNFQKLTFNSIKPKSIIDCGNAGFDFYVNTLIDYRNANNEVQDWMNYRDYLLGLIPNYSNKKYQ